VTIKVAKVTNRQRPGWFDRLRIKRGIEAVGQNDRFGPPPGWIFAHHQIEGLSRSKNNPISLGYYARFQSRIDVSRQKLATTKGIVDPGVAEVRNPSQPHPSLEP
jgi:hypothetical protein